MRAKPATHHANINATKYRLLKAVVLCNVLAETRLGPCLC
jgi:hypothetical protein